MKTTTRLLLAFLLCATFVCSAQPLAVPYEPKHLEIGERFFSALFADDPDADTMLVFAQNDMFRRFLQDHGVVAPETADLAKLLRRHRRLFCPSGFPEERILPLIRFGSVSFENHGTRDGIGTLAILAVIPPKLPCETNLSVHVLLPVQEDGVSVFIPGIMINGRFLVDLLEPELTTKNTN